MIVCDESGYEGEKLVGGVTDVFAHASVRLDEATAAACVTELRARIKSPATMYKANHLLRSKHRATLLWFLGPDGPLPGNASVYVIDKTYFLVTTLVDFLGAPPETTTFLYDAHRRTEQAGEFLDAANDYLRAHETAVLPRLDPLLPAIIRAAEYWGNGEPIRIEHDRQTTLSPARIAALKQRAPAIEAIEQLDSFVDHRVQIADFLAGVTYRIASEHLRGIEDPEVSAALAPYVDPQSLWIAPWLSVIPAT
ncbi:NAD-dependent protein deacetylase of SIR2 family [Kribbella antibiotica]|uniref:NAD-dependent protein deacetylase of SIR2 family n=1 Tax=Kribbella antibiotica TaxID=190195 RepID=A0A4R4YK29_9ACTN|nr:NAD-dependent protein deacetylase of SIR2 family [Kribbella antibiotica]TDD44379.1 NAD-dependent protein deacetylase of SIR2 family [Kribbella antibiotica]